MDSDLPYRSDERGNVVFNFVGNPIEELATFGVGYHRAGRTLLSAVMSKPGYRDNDCYPVFYLYRHAVELYLKAVFYKGAMLLDLVTEQTLQLDSIFKSHKLTVFLPGVKAIFEDRGWLTTTDGEMDPAVEDLFEQLKLLDNVDPRSYVFRYPTNLKGQSSLPKHTVYNVVEFAEQLDRVLESLDAAVSALDYEWSNAAEVIFAVQEILNELD